MAVLAFLEMVAGDSSPPGTYTGYQPPFSGTCDPEDALTFPVTRIQFDRLVSPRQFEFALEGEDHPQNLFDTLVVLDGDTGEVTLNSVDAVMYNVSGDTLWQWEVTDPSFFTVDQEYHIELRSADPAPVVDFNCECDDSEGWQTLVQLRRRLLIRLGFAAQADNPPPGMAILLDDFLQSTQKFLYKKYPAVRQRFFQWTLVPGIRYYDIPDNADVCTKRMDVHKVTWVGIEDVNGQWFQLTEGIDPRYYTSVAFIGYPSLYEIRQCIEIFPAPTEAVTKLRIKATFTLQPFAADGDTTSIDSELVFLWALGQSKAHYGHPDADNYIAMAREYLGKIVAGEYHTARFIPGVAPMVNMPMPIFLPLQSP